MIKTYKKGKSSQLSTNFKSTEFDCHGKGCCDETQIDEELVKNIQKVRDAVKKPITINSGYRCKTHNSKVGGAKSSNHMSGIAADLACPKDIKLDDFAWICEQAGFKGVLKYEGQGFCHCDMRATKYMAITKDNGKTFKSIGTFNPNPPVVAVTITVKAFQEAAKADGFTITIDGKWGPKTQAVAQEAVCKYLEGNYVYKNLTKLVQSAVGTNADGKFGKNTETAVKAWQKANGLTADGKWGINCWCKLLKVAKVVVSNNYKVKITASLLNYRDGAGTNYKVNGTLKKGEVCTVSKEAKDTTGQLWGYIDKGWISLKFTQKI